ncbi:hypothetical protein F753_21335 [Stutzerimonas chloritidismutans AW-1]|uniref:Uncharacterized protein n=1 Tax=Stutzerimonas chloritidismutans AW-1 TaxID=1263865 RepID=V4PMM9_STUCH|nr:hypothetical protein [Stutzerimonas chloritidismutans]ESQ97345.1 hypothetical protein F753_21335 [Stutzerimonas chloritidismutans AW-1]
MTDPLERAAAKAPPVIGSGCTQRYDPEALSPEQGTEFAGAAALWAELQAEQGNAGRPSSASAAGEGAPAGTCEHDKERG